MMGATAGSRLVVAHMRCKSMTSSGKVITLTSLKEKEHTKKDKFWRCFSFMMLRQTNLLKNALHMTSLAPWGDQVNWGLGLVVGWVGARGWGCSLVHRKDNGLQLKGEGCKVHWPGIAPSLTHGHKVSTAPSPSVGQSEWKTTTTKNAVFPAESKLKSAE